MDWQSCRMVFDTCTRAHPHSHRPLKRHNMLPCRIMPRMKRQHNISQWPDFDSLTHLTHLDHWQYSWQIPCFKLHNTLHVHFTPNAYWTSYALFLMIQYRNVSTPMLDFACLVCLETALCSQIGVRTPDLVLKLPPACSMTLISVAAAKRLWHQTACRPNNLARHPCRVPWRPYHA